MTYRVGQLAGSLGCAFFLMVACGGSSFEGAGGGAGAANGGTSGAGTSGEVNGGSADGGSAVAGRSSGGTSSAGATSGGTNNTGGVSSGGVTSGGVTSGGVTSGGVTSGGGGGSSMACNEDSDCVACAYPTAPAKTTDCYCASCAGTPLSKTACAANKAAWQAHCTQTPMVCPAIACIEPPVPACKSHQCVAN